MVRRLVNRLFGRTGPSTDAINAYVGGNASDDEVKLVEQMVRDDPALEKDLATQKALLEVLARVGVVQAPRSFAITPEMVAAAEGSESSISKLAELFAPQRKLALAPIVLAGFAALTVALLTIGDITGVVEQSGRDETSSTTGVWVAESDIPAAAGAPGSPGAPRAEEATAPLSSAEDSPAGVPEITVVVEKAISADSEVQSEAQALRLAATAAPAATGAPAAEAAAEVAPAAMGALESSTPGDEAGAEAPPSLAAQAAVPDEADITPDLSMADEAAKRDLPDAVDAADVEDLENASSAGGGVDDEAGVGAGPDAADGASAGVLVGAEEGVGPGAGNGITLPLWQLQVALAALAAAVIGAWAGLRRVRRD